jgi:hypothetical protein
VTQRQWTAQDLERELRRFEAELRAAELKETSAQIYVSRAGAFVRWLSGDYEPRGPRVRQPEHRGP